MVAADASKHAGERQKGSYAGLRTTLMTAALLGALCATAGAASAKTLYVSPHGKDTNKCTVKAPCKTIGRAVARARKGDTVSVARGTYAEDVNINKDISVVGVNGPIVNASGLNNGFLIDGAKAAGAAVRGFVVEKANFEGIFAEKTSRLTIANNSVRGNDLGAASKTPVGECAPQGPVPGDCGEGVHLMTVSNSHVTGNLVTGNVGGILLTDELGPTARNIVSKNRVLKNLYDCGITIAGHSTKAVSLTTGKPQPKLAGIYNNTISDNVSNDNGSKGEGAGILLAAAGPGAGVYDNVVQGNTANGNSLAGVTLHSHTPMQDLNGNKIIDNSVSNDGAKGDAEFGESGTVGILVGSGVTKLSGIVITGNKISNVHYGIYTKNAPKVNNRANKFTNVAVPINQI